MISTTMPAAQLQAWADTMPAADGHGILRKPLPACPECQAPADRIDVEGTLGQIDYVAVEPCGHMVIALYSIEQP